MITIRLESNQAARVINGIVDRRLIDKVMRQTISDVIRKYKTVVKRELSKRTGLPQKLFAPRIQTGATKVLQNGHVQGSLWVGTYRIPLVKTINAGYLRAGGGSVSVGTARKDKYSLARGTFLAEMNSGHQGIYQRKAAAATARGRDSRGRVRKGRLPIEEAMYSYRAMAEDILRGIVASVEFATEIYERFARKFEQYLRKIA